MKKIFGLIVTVMMLIPILAGCGASDNVVKIGHKNFTEQRILGNMFAILIEEKTDLQTEITEFGGTNLVFEALKNNEVDVYPEYTGTGYVALLAQSELKDPDEVYVYVKDVFKDEWNLNWGIPLGFNNTYTFSVLPEIAEEYNLKTFSDLAEAAPELTLIASLDFAERNDGLPGVQQAYGGFEFGEVLSMDAGLRYTAIDQREGEVMDAYSTDGMLIDLELVILEDDKNFFPPYYVAPLINGEFSEKYPEVMEVLNELGNQFTEEEVQQMNYEVDTLGSSERDVAENYLREKGFIE